MRSESENLSKIFNPKNIAVVGASNDISKIGGFIFSNILKQGKIEAYPINPRGEDIQGKKSFAKISEIGKSLDLVIIAIPSLYVIDIIKDCIKANSKQIIIISAGFKETGIEGKKREEELKKLIKDNNLTIIGPNCLGILNAYKNLNCSFAKDIPEKGGVALISQSGAIIDAIIDWSFSQKIGFSKILSLGNMAGVDELQMLKYLSHDEETKAIVFYMETLERGKEFASVLRLTSKKKPVIIIKPGKSELAKKAIGSHTGSLAQDSILVETLIEENNGILVDNLRELYNILIGLKSNYTKEKDFTIVTNAGGPGVLASDSISKTEFTIIKPGKYLQKKLSANLPNEASLSNPIDILGDAKSDRYSKTLEVLSKIPEINNILVLLTPQIMTDSKKIAEEVIRIQRTYKKNIIACFIGEKEIREAINTFHEEDFPYFETPNDAIFAMEKLRRYATFDYSRLGGKYHIDKNQVKKIREELKLRNGLLDFETSKKVLSILGIKVPERIIIDSPEVLKNIKLNSNKKYVMKADGENLLHKKELGGVIFGINSENLISKGEKMFEEISKFSKNFTITLEEKVAGVETIMGIKVDSTLGAFLMFGMGGTYVNLFKDAHFKPCPLTIKDAKDIVSKSLTFEMLKGYRGSDPVHLPHLYEILRRLSNLPEIFPEIAEIDFNPVICNGKGIYLVDVKLIIQNSN